MLVGAMALFAVAAIFTPPDAFSMLSLAVPLVALYEISVFCVMLIERRRMGPLIRNLRRTTDPLFRRAGLDLDEG